MTFLQTCSCYVHIAISEKAQKCPPALQKPQAKLPPRKTQLALNPRWHIQKLKPNYLIIEPPELVGGKVSISKSKPDLIQKIAKELKTKFIVGAGIHTSEDIKTAIKLGAFGIAISSAITKAKNPSSVLRKLIKWAKKEDYFS